LTLRIDPKINIDNIDILIEDLPELLYETFKSLLKQKKGIKVQVYLSGLFYHPIKNLEEEKPLFSKNKYILNKDDIKSVLESLLNEIKIKIDTWHSNEAYWRLQKVLYIDLKLREYKPISGSSYIPTPERISDTKSTINIKNEDQKCFKYCILYGLFKDEIKKNAQEMYHYKKLEEKYPNFLNFEGIQFPVKVSDIKKFCRMNKNISINIYLFAENTIIPYATYSEKEKREHHINLLLLNFNDNYHYIYIKNLSRLISSQINNEQHKKFICDRCLKFSYTEEKFKQHIEFCDYYLEHEKAMPVLPEKGKNILEFKNLQNKIQVPLIYYTDFESVIKNLPDEKLKSKHEMCSYSFFALGQNEFYKNFEIYTGNSANDTINHYIDSLKNEAIKLDLELKDRLKKFKKPRLTKDQYEKFKQAKNCHLCKCPFRLEDEKIDLSEGKFEIIPKDIIVRDHCHILGKFRGAAHQICNLKARTSLNIKIIFHNGSNYDFKFIVRKLYKICQDIEAIPFTDEKFLTFSIKIPNTNIKFTFIDSLRFLPSSLDNLTKNLLKKEGGLDNFRYTKMFFEEKYPNIADSQLDYIIQKGVFPYEFLDSFEKLNETKLPSIDSFYSSIKDSKINEDDYQRAQKVWSILKCKNLKEYLEAYLSIDVFLLTDIFEAFRKTSMKYYELDPAHYYSSPGLSWDAMLKFTEIKLELLTDPDMLYFFMEGIRGGLSFISKRYVESNNKYMKNYDLKKESSYFIPVDANNLYGNAMSYKLPYGNFRWCTDEEIEDLEKGLFNIPDNSDTGFTLQVDLEYPQELHDYHNDFPFYPEHKTIEENILSDYQKRLMNKKLGSISKTPKLIASLNDKKKIIIDYRTLKQALKHGLKLVKIHSAISYDQKAWLKSYIDKNTELRKQSDSDFEKDFFKLMNNAVYGKTIENVMKRQDIKFCTEKKKALKQISKINFKRETIFSKNLVAIHMNKQQIKFNKPIFTGFCVLEMSKYIMNEFVYEYIKPKWKNNVEICGGDTDSLFLHIKTSDFYEDIKPDIEKWFDTSNFSENNKFGLERMNAKVLGKFKIETEDKKLNKNADNIITEFVGLRAKNYNMKLEIGDNYEFKIAEKGVPKHKKHDEINIYKDILFNETQNFVEFNRIGSKRMNVYTIHEKKIALSNFDDKRYILDDGINTLAFGHYKINEIENWKELPLDY
jgi:hypothetical protein